MFEKKRNEESLVTIKENPGVDIKCALAIFVSDDGTAQLSMKGRTSDILNALLNLIVNVGTDVKMSPIPGRYETMSGVLREAKKELKKKLESADDDDDDDIDFEALNRALSKAVKRLERDLKEGDL